MRTTIAILSMLALSACGDNGAGEQALKTAYRSKFVANCVSSASAAMPAAAQAAATQAANTVCGCTADKVMQNATAAELASIAPARVMAAGRECATKFYPGVAKRLPGLAG